MRMIKSKLALLAFATVLCSCSEEKSPENGFVTRESESILLTDSVFYVSHNTLALDVDVSATGEWRAFSNDTWITVDTKERRGSGKLTLSMSENTDKFYPREGTVSLTNKYGKLTIVISQGSCGVLTFNVGEVIFKMIPVAHGTFQMGLSADGYNETPIHSVTLTKDYYMGETEVTQGLWYAVMGQKPTSDGRSWFSPGLGDNYPAYLISYEDCEEFLVGLNKMTGQKFRFPTEAEWEFAAKGGNKSKGDIYAGSNTLEEVAWWEGNSGNNTHTVKTKAANELGLYDMSGNVYEWCYDWYDYYPSATETDPTGPTYGYSRVLRGGDYDGSGWYHKCTGRQSEKPSYRGVGSLWYGILGFRLAL